jgi:hypothetical protein
MAQAQLGGIKGYIKDLKSGVELDLAGVQILNTDKGATANADGYYIINDVKPGVYYVVATYSGYDADTTKVEIVANKIQLNNFFLSQTVMLIDGGRISENKKKLVALTL